MYTEDPISNRFYFQDRHIMYMQLQYNLKPVQSTLKPASQPTGPASWRGRGRRGSTAKPYQSTTVGKSMGYNQINTAHLN